MDFHVIVVDNNLVDEISAKTHPSVHIHSLKPARKGATDLADVPLEIDEGQPLFGFPGQIIDGPLDALEPLLDGSPAGDKLFELDRLLLVGIKETPALALAVADLMLQSP